MSAMARKQTLRMSALAGKRTFSTFFGWWYHQTWGGADYAPASRHRGRHCPAHPYISDVAEVGRLLGGAKEKALVLYCNGPFCGKTKRLGTELLGAGYTNVRRYQLGAPGWRTLASQAMQTELAALRYIGRDKTAVWIDAREPSAFKAGTVAGA